MSAGLYDIQIDQGTTFILDQTIADEDENPIDISAWTFRGQIRRTFDAGDIFASFTAVVANQTTDKGKVTFLLTDTETSAIPAEAPVSKYVYDIEAVIGANVMRLMQGKVILSAEVTR